MDGFVKWPCPECGVQRARLPEDFVLHCPTCDFTLELAPDVDPSVETPSSPSQVSTLQ